MYELERLKRLEENTRRRGDDSEVDADLLVWAIRELIARRTDIHRFGAHRMSCMLNDYDYWTREGKPTSCPCTCGLEKAWRNGEPVSITSIQMTLKPEERLPEDEWQENRGRK